MILKASDLLFPPPTGGWWPCASRGPGAPTPEATGSFSSCRSGFDTDCRRVPGSGSGSGWGKSCFFGNGGGWRDSVSAGSGSGGGFFTANASWVIPSMSLSTPSVYYLFT